MKDAPVFDRAAHLRDNHDHLEAHLRASDSLLVPVHAGLNLLEAGDDDRVSAFLPTIGEAGALLELGGELVWLGEVDGRACFGVDISALAMPHDHPAIPSRVEARDLRYALARITDWQAELAAYALVMLGWHRRHRFCGSCGREARPRRGGHVRVCVAEDCGAEMFPRVDPAVLVLVRHGDRFLLGRQAGWPRGMYSTLAGFVEPGETLEQAVAREVVEETGIVVDDIQYEGSQPWPFPCSLMAGFTATAKSTEIVLADDELEDAAWFTANEIHHPTRPGFFVPPPQSLAGWLLARYAPDPPAPQSPE